MGKTVEFGTVRVHRFADHFKVTDLTHAGKRGKKVRIMTLSPSYQYRQPPAVWLESMSKALSDYPSYDRIKSFIGDILHDAPGEINLNESEVRGVDVNPGGTEKIELKGQGVEITALPDSFLVKATALLRAKNPNGPANDSGSELTQDTLYGPAGKRDAMVFYNWLKANKGEASRMDIQGLQKLWHDLGIRYDGH